MKISQSVRALYENSAPLIQKLEKKAGEIFEAKREKQWFYTGRVKSLESFAQKLETGRVENPAKMEDFFACTLVVDNRKSITKALDLINSEFEITERRPKNFETTHKSADAFPFDDLRLYVKLKKDERLPSGPIHDIVFEIQIKTFLQHAWGIATHDLVYKGDDINWSKARVAYQIKAMLEHAEISVEQVDSLSSSTGLAMTDNKTREKKSAIDWLVETRPRDSLPKDLVRLSETILDLCRSTGIEFKHLKRATNKATTESNGANLTNLSPYATIVKIMFHEFTKEILAYLKTPSKGRRIHRIFISDDEEIKSLLEDCNSEKYIYIDPEVLRPK
ncbi:hypothetical protein FA101_28130 [Pseudomonas aeruginosa]|nr:hypothetical protein [Pseudomonas aeruginosa]